MSQNKQLAKNSLVMFARLIITSVIGLYGVRILLQELGVSDYGLFAIIGGVIALVNVLSTTLISTSNRFLAFEIGKGDVYSTNTIFNSLFLLHLVFSFLFLVIIETLGVWYVVNKLNVDPSKVESALILLHCSALTVFLSTTVMPYEGLVTVKEKFTIRAALEILNSVLNLFLVLSLFFITNNKLITYAFGLVLVRLIITLCYFFYSRTNFLSVVRFRFVHDIHIYRMISGFFVWQLVYIMGNVISKQGSAIILNSFFGTAINAAYSVADKIHQFIFSFVKNLNQVSVPQIIKSHSRGDSNRSLTLIYKLSKYTFFIILIISFPILLSIDYILQLWLGEYPDFTIWFVVLLTVAGLVSSLESGFDALIDATGKIRKTKIIFSLIFLTVLPVVYLLFLNGFKPYWVTILFILGEIIFMLFQLNILKKLTEFDIYLYFKETIIPVFLVSILILPQLLFRFFENGSFLSFVFVSLISFMLTIFTIYFAGLDKSERTVITSKLSASIAFNKLKFFKN